MAFYLVKARPLASRMPDLEAKLARDEFRRLRPFGPTLTHSLRNARVGADGYCLWEEEDYCDPPLAQERAAVLDRYFTDLSVEEVAEMEGWGRLRKLDRLFPSLADADSAEPG